MSSVSSSAFSLRPAQALSTACKSSHTSPRKFTLPTTKISTYLSSAPRLIYLSLQLPPFRSHRLSHLSFIRKRTARLQKCPPLLSAYMCIHLLCFIPSNNGKKKCSLLLFKSNPSTNILLFKWKTSLIIISSTVDVSLTTGSIWLVLLSCNLPFYFPCWFLWN